MLAPQRSECLEATAVGKDHANSDARFRGVAQFRKIGANGRVERELAFVLQNHRRRGRRHDFGERGHVEERRVSDEWSDAARIDPAIRPQVDEPAEASDGERDTGCGALGDADGDDRVESGAEVAGHSDAARIGAQENRRRGKTQGAGRGSRCASREEQAVGEEARCLHS